MGIIIMF